MRSKRDAAALAAGLAAALFLTACGQAKPAGEPGEVAGIVLDTPYTIAAGTLDSTSGEPFDLHEDTTASVTLVFFGYTHCPDICSLVMAEITSALARLEPEQRKQVQVALITSDPARDSVPVLRRYLERYDDAYLGLTGDLDEIVRIGRSVAIAVDKGEKLESGGYTVAHGGQIMALRADDTVGMFWQEDVSAPALAADLQSLLNDQIPGLKGAA